MKQKKTLVISSMLCFLSLAVILFMQRLIGTGSASAASQQFLSPPTGDETNLTLWLIIGGAALAALAVLIVLTVSKSRKKK